MRARRLPRMILACVVASSLVLIGAPTHVLSPVPAGYTVSIRAFYSSQYDETFTSHSSAQPRPVARIHQKIDAAGGQVAALVKVCASGPINLGHLRLTGPPSNEDFRVRYSRFSDGANITAAVVAGVYRTSRIQDDDCFRYRIDVIRTKAARTNDLRTFRLTVNPEGPGWANLSAATHVGAAYPCDVIVNGQPAC